MGEDDQFSLVQAMRRRLLQHRVNADATFGQDAGHIGQDAGLVGHAQAQVMAGFNIGKNIILGYAYDFPMSSLKNYSSGSHEVMIGARFAKIRHNDDVPAESPVETPTSKEK